MKPAASMPVTAVMRWRSMVLMANSPAFWFVAKGVVRFVATTTRAVDNLLLVENLGHHVGNLPGNRARQGARKRLKAAEPEKLKKKG
jgi:hypothetical protein